MTGALKRVEHTKYFSRSYFTRNVEFEFVVLEVDFDLDIQNELKFLW